MEKASFVSRFIAYIVDQVILGMIGCALMLPFMGLFGVAAATESNVLSAFAGLAFLIVLPIVMVLNFIYFGFFWSRDGQSVGMKLMRIRVVSRDGGTVSFIRAALRGTFGYMISGFLCGLGFLWAAFDPAGEAWHDKLFATRVVDA